MFTRHNRNIVTPIVGKVKTEALERLTIGTDEVQSIFMVALFNQKMTLTSLVFRRLYMSSPNQGTLRFELVTIYIGCLFTGPKSIECC